MFLPWSGPDCSLANILVNHGNENLFSSSVSIVFHSDIFVPCKMHGIPTYQSKLRASSISYIAKMAYVFVWYCLLQHIMMIILQ